MDQETLDDLRISVLENLPDILIIRPKGTDSVSTSLQGDGMGGVTQLPNNSGASQTYSELYEIQYGSSAPVTNSVPIYRCRVTAPRAASRGAEIVVGNQAITETNVILVIGIPIGGKLPDISPEDQVDVEDGETKTIRTWEVQRLLPHSSPFTLHVNCIDL